jgi:large subunit ribosomal protein L7/L12
MAVTKEQVVEYLGGLTILEMSELVSELEETWGVSAAAAVVAGPAGGGAEEAEKTEFDVILSEVGGSKIKVIKAVKEITGLGLKDAKAFVDGLPKAVKEKLPKDQAQEIADKLIAVGATAEVK